MGLVDTNCDPDPIEYVIACNDDALKSIKLILETLAQAIIDKKNDIKVYASKEELAKKAKKKKRKKNKMLVPQSIAKKISQKSVAIPGGKIIMAAITPAMIKELAIVPALAWANAKKPLKKPMVIWN